MCNCAKERFQPTEKDKKFILAINKFKGQKGALIPILQETQDIYGYLPEESIKSIARELKIPPSKVYGVATFYAQFHLKPRGKYIIRVCLGTACHVRGGANILEAIKSNLGIQDGQTTQDLMFTLESVACLGACGLAPVIMVNEETYGRLTPDKITSILKIYQERGEA